MILVVWNIVPENLQLYALPPTPENLRIAAAAHGHYIGAANQEPAIALNGILSKEFLIYDDEMLCLPHGITPTQHYSLVVVSGVFL